MRLAYEDAQCAVFDDVLSETSCRSIWRQVQLAELIPLHVGNPASPWRAGQHAPLRAKEVFLGLGEELRDQRVGPNQRAFPTQTPADDLLARILESAEQFERWVGPHGPGGWKLFTAAIWAYPLSTTLGWHTDGADGTYTGAFTYYAHPRWGSDWGGELLVAPPSPKLDAAIDRVRALGGVRFEPDAWDDVLLDTGVGAFVQPKPNRLVILRGNVLHRVNAVGPAAGGHVRASISGFFVRDPEGPGPGRFTIDD